MSLAVSHHGDHSAAVPVPAVDRPRLVPLPTSGPHVTVRESGWTEYVELARTESLENRRCARRVRYEARDALGVIAFSAAASTVVAVLSAVALRWAA